MRWCVGMGLSDAQDRRSQSERRQVSSAVETARWRGGGTKQACDTGTPVHLTSAALHRQQPMSTCRADDSGSECDVEGSRARTEDVGGCTGDVNADANLDEGKGRRQMLVRRANAR